MSYYLAPSLAKLRDQINDKWPNRDKKSDGWVGDTSHQARASDHNPDYADGGVVRALDVDKDGINVDDLLEAVIGEPRVAYVIWNRRIWQHATGWKPYYGSNGHTIHIHISIRHNKAAESAGAWKLGGTVKPVAVVKPKPKPAAKPKPKAASKAWPDVNLYVDGDFGKVTRTALQRLLKDHPEKSVRYTGLIDGDFGKLTRISAQRWLDWTGHYKGRIDGDFGSMSVKALQSFLLEKGELPSRAYVDGKWGNVTDKAFQRYINSQAKHYK